ncbi:DUF3574 domain-containing protein [Streptomyces sp. NBC_01142]|uniref:DUF3574 domain-containing protein n=1 Tax=Streptomyces sp. NBC_01142 TaxID=2975865 RepID=UPI00224F7EF7|nr:DUF3574 domain-containing protein [Streptomyces sp. NBC_01142]MCX4825040.1 DUF3574 domain-containing protein [Streptomyces sp. NBC_01142]
MRHIRISMPAAAVFAAVVLFFTAGGPLSDVAFDTPAASAAAQRTAGEQGSPYVATHLYFGTGRHDGNPPISDEEFMKFIADVVTPRFPSGLTLQEGRGQWRDKDGDINRERSYELTVLYPVTQARDRDADIEYIRRLYCKIYDLESVGRADVRAQADF